MNADMIANILSFTIVAGTPLIFTALGELVSEKSGVLNLGAEGMMSFGAVTAFAVTLNTGNPLLGTFAGMAAGMLLSSLFALFTLGLLANQVAAGLALSIFGYGLAAFIGKPYESKHFSSIPSWPIPGLSEIPIIGHGLFNHQPIVYFSWFMFVAIFYFLNKTRTGLTLRAIGESPNSAHDIGYHVIRYRLCAVLFGGGMAGIGGAFMSVFYSPSWVEGIVAGRGWIALALVVFATWRPLRVILGAYLFGGMLIIQLFIQGSGVEISVPAQLLSALPYLATIFVLVIISRDKLAISLNSPASLGKPWKAH